ncbi:MULTISPECIES: DUF3221 domain-containing protein [Bacillus]|uniref:DUF3221 domain-containing protein n=1 Tax=Bacillus TaxID=1386 RepID=UPI0012FF3D8A|nr:MULTISPECIES: DUF3221 domain-containing protein [Bacillus]
MKRVSSFILFIFILSACGQQGESNNSINTSYINKQEGIIAEIQENQNNRKQILVIPNTDFEDISNKTPNELVKIAQEKDGAYYSIAPGKYEELELGTKVIVYWDGDQNDTEPPQRGADKIEVITNK